jgi:hypothetical protein
MVDFKEAKKDYLYTVPDSPVVAISYSNRIGVPAVTISVIADASKKQLLRAALGQQGFTGLYEVPAHDPLNHQQGVAKFGQHQGEYIALSADIPTPTKGKHSKTWDIEADRARVDAILESIPELNYKKGFLEPVEQKAKWSGNHIQRKDANRGSAYDTKWDKG